MLDFVITVGTNLRWGVTFPLADGTSMPTSIQETGGQVTAPMVRSALEIAEKDFKRRGVTGGTMALVRIQRMVIFQAEVIQYMAKVTPEYSVPEITIEQNAAVVSLQTSLKLLEQPDEK